MTREQNLERLPGRRMVENDSEDRRAMLPMHAVSDACDDREKAILMRFTEASEMSKGNDAVCWMGGHARGRYERFAHKVDFETYKEAETGAYRWILMSAFGGQARGLAESLARLNGQRVSFDFVELGRTIANTDNWSVAMGAAIGSARACAWMLFDAYRDYAEFWKVRESAAKAGRQLTDEEGVRRQRRADMTRRVIEGYRADIDGSTA